MSIALKRAAEEYREELKLYDIIVNPESNTILVGDRAIRLDNFTTSVKCRRVLRDCINECKAKVAAKQQSKQAKFF
jgi:hypothetical protein